MTNGAQDISCQTSRDTGKSCRRTTIQPHKLIQKEQSQLSLLQVNQGLHKWAPRQDITKGLQQIRPQYVKFVFVQHNIRFHTLENECKCYSNILVFFFCFFPIFLLFFCFFFIFQVYLTHIKQLFQKYDIYHSSRVFSMLECFNHSRMQMHEWYVWFILCLRQLASRVSLSLETTNLNKGQSWQGIYFFSNCLVILKLGFVKIN